MLAIPAIDIRNGKCVRLTQGDYDKENIYFDSPLEVAKAWSKIGIKYIHVVDLDGALVGKRINSDIIKEICKVIDVELGGGIRTMEDIEKCLELGVKRVIIGTAAIKNPEFVKSACEKYGDKIIVSLDAKDGFVATDGWTKVLEIKAVDFAKKLQDYGLLNIIYTDIATDGMLMGTNVPQLLELKNAVDMNITASGGISCLKDIEELKQYKFFGVIIGKAIYENKIAVEDLVC